MVRKPPSRRRRIVLQEPDEACRGPTLGLPKRPLEAPADASRPVSPF